MVWQYHLPVMGLQKKVLVVKEIWAAFVDNDQVSGAEDDQVDSFESWDHHLVDCTWYEDEKHAVCEVLKNISHNVENV